MSITYVTSSSEVSKLAAGLRDPHRDRPWGIVTIPATAGGPQIDIEQLDDDAGDVCEFFVIQTGTLSRELETMLPDRCQVYGGASRIYPVGTEWMAAPERSPLRFLHDNSNATRVTERLVTDALGMANAAGLFAQHASTSVRASGEVRTILAGGARALVQLDSGGFATIVHELTFPEVPLEWAIREGQRVDGQYDPQTKRLALDVVHVDSNELLEHYPHGTVTLAFVVSVERQSGVLAVHPSLPITVTKTEVSSNIYDRVDLLLAPGDVVPVRVVRDEQGRTRLRLNDVDDDETIQPALALVPGGDPWLAEERHKPEPAVETTDLLASEPHAEANVKPGLGPADAPTQPDETDGQEAVPVEHTAPRPAPGLHRAGTPLKPETEPAEPAPQTVAKRQSTALVTTQLALQQERERNRQLEGQLKHIGGESALEKAAIMRLELGEIYAENHALRDQLRKLRADQQTQRTMLRKSRQLASVPGYADRRERFNNGEEWVRHEIYLAWVDRLSAGDREHWLLPANYAVGENFAPSLEQLDDPSRDKALKAVVDVLTGRIRELPARGLHPLRTGEGMSAADVVRSDGARCMRVHIEKSVASARRLHFWQCDDGVIELSRVVVHDDMEP